MAKVLNNANIDHQINRIGSMISIHFCKDPVMDFETAAHGNNPKFKIYFHGMLDRGVYLPPSAFESYFLNDALSYEDIDHTVNALSEFVHELK
jgi:glutamate-1-semialdehyde 2,1-aminomutase